MESFMRVEGVNIASVMYDTDDISVIRGASFMLKDSIIELYRAFADELQPITLGASEGIFRLLESASEIKVLEKVRGFFATKYPHLTFVVVSAHSEQFDAGVKNRLLSLSRMQQLLQFNHAPDADIDDAAVCCVTGVRKGSASFQEKRNKYGGMPMSASAAERMRYGIHKRSAFYANELAGVDDDLAHQMEALPITFTDDLEALSAANGRAKTQNKIACIYLDGNRFGSIQAAYINQAPPSEAEQRQIEFDQLIRHQRARLMSKLLRFLRSHPHLPKGSLPLETLMWGGDELLLVVPASIGMEVLQLIYQQTETWSLGGLPLSHAGGIVFCHHKTPVAKVRHTAWQLAEYVKCVTNREGSFFEYLALESVDCPADLSTQPSFWQLRYKELGTFRPPLKPHVKSADTLDQLQTLMSKVPRSQAYQLALCAYQNQSDLSEGKMTSFNKQHERTRLVLEEVELSDVEQVASVFLGIPINTQLQKAWLWIHLVELWDYLDPYRNDEPATDGGAQ